MPPGTTPPRSPPRGQRRLRGGAGVSPCSCSRADYAGYLFAPTVHQPRLDRPCSDS
ncbi:hypothetical protein QJS66_02770 [Kocuria rhizophila]|nr:hypothetical protein QJS66_02770 [Kocuria rhizophila]